MVWLYHSPILPVGRRGGNLLVSNDFYSCRHGLSGGGGGPVSSLWFDLSIVVGGKGGGGGVVKYFFPEWGLVGEENTNSAAKNICLVIKLPT
jgi:hypothetical protein